MIPTGFTLRSRQRTASTNTVWNRASYSTGSAHTIRAVGSIPEKLQVRCPSASTISAVPGGSDDTPS